MALETLGVDTEFIVDGGMMAATLFAVTICDS